MKNKNLVIVVLLLVVCSFCCIQNVNAATSFSFNGTAGAFGGKYEKFFSEEQLSSNVLNYVKVVVHASSGNKLKVGFLHTEDWLSNAKQVASTGTLQASNNTHTIYFVPQNRSCPSGGTCIKVSSQYSTDGSGNDLTYGFMSGIRFTNESWFYGDLYVNGTITMY